MTRRGIGTLAAIWMLAGCAEPAQPGGPLSGSEAAAVDSLASAAALAEERWGVPGDVVLAVAWVETSLGTGPAGEPEAGHAADGMHAPRTVGIGGLRPWLDDPLRQRAEATIGAGAEDIAQDPVLGLLATAAILRELAAERYDTLPPAAGPGEWHEVLADYAGLRGDEARALYADRVLDVLRRGLQATAVTGEVVTLRSRTVAPAAGVGAARGYHHPEYTGARWIPAREGHYEEGRDGHEITHIIIHTMQGTYEQSIGWFQSPDNPNRTSTQYLIRSSDGDITQMVHEEDAARHIGGWNPFTIGIEHEGWLENPERWYTDTMYRASARLVRHLCDKYDIPRDREHIVGHVEVPGAVSGDPGPGWDWDKYMRMVEEAGEPDVPRFDAGLVAVDYPETLEAGHQAVVWIELENEGSATWSLETTRLGTSSPEDHPSPFYVEDDWINDHRATPPDSPGHGPGDVARFSFAVRAPDVEEETEVVDTFRLVEEDVTWFGPEVDIAIRVTPSQAAQPDEPDAMGDGGVALPDREDTPSGDDREADAGTMHGGCAAAGTADPAGRTPWLGVLLLAARRRRRRR